MFLIGLLGSYTANAKVIKNEALADSKAYCQYIKDKNKAQSILLQSPDAIARLDNGLSYNNFQKIAVAGLSKDLADISKAQYVNELINTECTYYALNEEAKLHIQYALLAVKVQALNFKLQQIEIAKSKLIQLLKTMKRRIHKQNETVITYYGIESSLIKLGDEEREIYIELAVQPVPRLIPTNLKQLLKNLVITQEKRKKTLNKLEKQNNWSVRVEVGTQQDLSNGLNQNVQAYFALLLRYNLGSIYSNSKKSNSLNDYMQWQKKQVLGTQSQLKHLITSIVSLKVADEQRLALLMHNYNQHFGLSKKLSSINSMKAARFRQAVEVDKIMMKIEINYLKRSIALLKEL
jgi:hypothetical protein